MSSLEERRDAAGSMLAFWSDMRIVDIPPEWLPFLAYGLLLIALAAAETLLPLHRTSEEAGGRIATNFAMGLLNAALLAALPLSSVIPAEWAREMKVGLFNAVATPALIAFSATIAIRSLAGYALHRLSHAVPLLWRVHRVHHCDTAVDLSTGFRNHPIETLFMAVGLALAATVFGLSVPALLAYEIAAACFVLWGHANLRLPAGLDRALGWLLVTPAMHHVHHSARQPETDSNFGEVFSLWDRVFGTYRHLDAAEIAAMRIGLGESSDREAGRLVAQLCAPLRS